MALEFGLIEQFNLSDYFKQVIDVRMFFVHLCSEHVKKATKSRPYSELNGDHCPRCDVAGCNEQSTYTSLSMYCMDLVY